MKCIGFIMDGNRRWAKSLNKKKIEGHLAGKDKLFEVVSWIKEKKIPHAVFYAFSTENWKRDRTEVEDLMNIFVDTIAQFEKNTDTLGVRVKVIGTRQDLSLKLQQAIENLERETDKPGVVTTVWIGISYGGRAEIIAAVNEAIKNGETVNEISFSDLLWTATMPDPDIIVRTGGDNRLSNFLPWQTVYSELFFIDTYWPAFTKEEFERILNKYEERERRLGK